MNELALFAGAGGGILGGHLLGWRTVCAVEINPYCREVLKARQDDKALKPFPIWDDVCTFDGLPWRGCVDVISGGFPCQDISIAGGGAGLDGERSGLWSEFARIIREVRPRFVFVENSPMLVSRGLGQVLGDLAAMGYDAAWGVLSAEDLGAHHKRDRIWIVAHSNGLRKLESQRGVENQWRRLGDGSQAEVGDSMRSRCQEHDLPAISSEPGQLAGEYHLAWDEDPGDDAESGVGRMAPGMAHGMDRIKAIGNGQVSAVAAAAFRHLSKIIRG